ncbi:MAG: FAD-dependent oxidoreductase [Acidimicrobiia bacterium]
MPSVLIVGAGIFGASLAHRLSGQGWAVTLVEQYQPGHVRASSGGESRLIRFSHGSDPWHTRSAWRSLRLWRELEEETGAELLVTPGVAWFAGREDGWEVSSERVLREEGIPVERLDPKEAAELFPDLRYDDLALVVYEPEAGILHARRAVQVMARQVVRRGAHLRTGRAEPDGASLLVDGERLRADRVVWACGPWIARLFPGLVELRVTQQDVFFFGAGPEWSTPPVPGWVDYDQAAYGLGDLDGRGMKLAPDVEGPDFDPDHDPRVPLPENEQRARRYLERRFPSLAGAPLVGSRTCQYALTGDTRFVVAPHPEHEEVWLLGGGSGHGFKHGPALAEYVQRLLEGEERPDPRLGLGERSPDRSLRTAGRQGARR